MRIHEAKFVTSAAVPSEYPRDALPEIVFCGRSNVGKSSILNSLLGRHSLVKTSKTPGKTRRINFFDADGKLRLVDLPGYGFARVPRAEQDAWRTMIETYLLARETLRLFVLLIDIRHPPQRPDLEMLTFLRRRQLPLTIVATKADKLAPGRRRAQIQALATAFGQELLEYSVPGRIGRKQLWTRIMAACQCAGGP